MKTEHFLRDTLGFISHNLQFSHKNLHTCIVMNVPSEDFMSHNKKWEMSFYCITDKIFLNPVKGDVSGSELNAGGGQFDTTSEINEGVP